MRKSVLIVDDDVATRVLLGAVLSGEAYAVETAGGGLEAIRKLEGKRFDLLLLDLKMPDVSGFDVLARLEVLRPGLPCVVVISAAAESLIDRSTTPNVVAHLRKPFDLDELRRVLSDCAAVSL